MKRAGTIALCLSFLAAQSFAIEWTPKQRWTMRVLGAGFVGLGFLARNNESVNNQRADDTINQFNSTHSNSAPNFLNDQFSAVGQQSAYQRTANAWSIAKNASWGMAGLLFTISAIPNSWTRPVERGDGVIIGYDVRVGGKTEKK